ncbi:MULTISPECIES: hypothetical protein [unclassified Lactococcus]|nr:MULTISPECIES: hypothetical protein [unclassified Lactococcus]
MRKRTKHLSVCLATKVARANRKPLLAHAQGSIFAVAIWRYR